MSTIDTTDWNIDVFGWFAAMNKKPLDEELVCDEYNGITDRRTDLRFKTEQVSALQLDQRTTFVEVLDLSEGGAKCRIATGLVPSEGSKVCLTLVDGTWKTGIVRWIGLQTFGLEFDNVLTEPQDRLHFEHLGYKSYSDILRLQKQIHGSN